MWRRAAAVEEAETVSVELAAAPDGVTVAGEKAQVPPAGNPVQLRVVADANPFCGVTLSVIVPLWLGEIVSDAGETAREKVGGKLMVKVAEATALTE